MSCRKPLLAILIAIAACLGATACTHWIFGNESVVDENWGDAVEHNVQAQVADPESPASLEGPEGIDASTAERVAERYYRGQETQQTRRARAVVIGGAR
jgi:type IV pilus biogenesis protein CpaD/CtpE